MVLPAEEAAALDRRLRQLKTCSQSRLQVSREAAAAAADGPASRPAAAASGPLPPPTPPAQQTLGRFLAGRIAAAGVTHFFGVPGDFNLTLLDGFLEEPRLKMVSNCNELNGGWEGEGVRA